jgi:DNA repair exonuclease SbcCD nuclease subunit
MRYFLRDGQHQYFTIRHFRRDIIHERSADFILIAGDIFDGN